MAKEYIQLSLNETGEILLKLPTGADAVVVSADHADYLAEAFRAIAADARDGSLKRFNELIDLANTPLATERDEDDWMKQVMPGIESLMPPGLAPSGRAYFSLIIFHPCRENPGMQRIQYGSNAPREMARLGLNALRVGLQLDNNDGEMRFPKVGGAN